MSCPMFGPHMSADYFYAKTSGGAPKRSSTLSRPTVPRGTVLTGRIVHLLIGQCHGFIRLPNAREIYFHRADLQEGSAFNDLQIGDAVAFELLEDAVSGARAARGAPRAASMRDRPGES
jgi:cold shock CspA family protein